MVGYLVNELRMESGRLTAKGYGESRPVADNATDEGRGTNRRVDFLVRRQAEPDGESHPTGNSPRTRSWCQPSRLRPWTIADP